MKTYQEDFKEVLDSNKYTRKHAIEDLIYAANNEEEEYKMMILNHYKYRDLKEDVKFLIENRILNNQQAAFKLHMCIKLENYEVAGLIHKYYPELTNEDAKRLFEEKIEEYIEKSYKILNDNTDYE